MTLSIRTLLVTFMVAGAAYLPQSADGREFHLGIISDKPVEKKISGYAPLARYVGYRLKPFGVTGGTLAVADSLEEMLQMILKKEVDVVLESAFSTIKIGKATGMKAELLVWKHGTRDYRSVFFVRKESPITRLADLKGKVLALQDVHSTSAFLMPIAELRSKGFSVAPANGKAAGADVRYLLVGHEKNQAFSVIQKKADAGAFASDDWNELPDREKADLRIIYSTKPVLRYLASFHPALPADLSRAISEILVQMDRDPEGRKILDEASQTTKIEPLTKRDYDSLEYVRKLMQRF